MSTTSTRLLTLLTLLQTRRDWSGSLLSRRLQISDRAVRRDIDRLREMGYNIHATMGPEGGYRLEAGSDLPPLLFDDDQTVAIAVALQTASAVGAGIEEAALRALTTIRQVMPSRLRHRLDVLEVIAIAQRPGQAAPMAVAPDLLISLASTIRARDVVRVDYTPRQAQPADRTAPVDGAPRPPRRVEPHHLVVAQGHWYLLAFDLDRDDWRLFSVDRITPRTPTGPRFIPRDVPGGDVQEFVSARFKGRDINEWPCRGAVVLDLPVSAVLPFVGDGAARALGHDRCILEAGSWSWGALASSYGRFEVPMKVIGPPELTAAFAVQAQRYATTAATAQTNPDPPGP